MAFTAAVCSPHRNAGEDECGATVAVRAREERATSARLALGRWRRRVGRRGATAQGESSEPRMESGVGLACLLERMWLAMCSRRVVVTD